MVKAFTAASCRSCNDVGALKRSCEANHSDWLQAETAVCFKSFIMAARSQMTVNDSQVRRFEDFVGAGKMAPVVVRAAHLVRAVAVQALGPEFESLAPT